MEVITFDSAAFRKLQGDLNKIMEFIEEQHKRQRDPSADDEMWIDNYDACTFLKISERTLQRLRAAKKITYSRLDRQVYYQVKEIKRCLLYTSSDWSRPPSRSNNLEKTTLTNINIINQINYTRL